MNNKNGQEEMVGFTLIVVIVAVIILIVLAIMLYNKDDSSVVQSYEVESFVSALLTSSTDCSESFQNHLSVQKVISRCIEGKKCENGKLACDLLKDVLSGTIKESWGTDNSYFKGYRFRIVSPLNQSILIENGNLTGSSRAAFQELILNSKDINVSLEVFG